MLQHEIEPFGDAQILAQCDIIEDIENLLDQFPDAESTTILVTRDQLKDWLNKARSARSGFTRFKICALDEWKQKERYEKYAKEHGYPYS